MVVNLSPTVEGLLLITFCVSLTYHFSNDSVQLRDILQTLSQRVVDTATTSYINVRRHHIWEDSARILRRKRFDPRSIISVKFADDDGTSEGAVDLGGPRREFLRLLLQASNLQSGVFQGPEDRRVLFANSLGGWESMFAELVFTFSPQKNCIAWSYLNVDFVPRVAHLRLYQLLSVIGYYPTPLWEVIYNYRKKKELSNLFPFLSRCYKFLSLSSTQL